MIAGSLDRRILYATAFLRALATGMIAVLLAAYLPILHFPADVVGWVVAAGLAGNAAAYDVLLYRALRRIQPPEERGSEHQAHPKAQ